MMLLVVYMLCMMLCVALLWMWAIIGVAMLVVDVCVVVCVSIYHTPVTATSGVAIFIDTVVVNDIRSVVVRMSSVLC